MEAAVISHDDAVEDIESKTELIVEHVGKGNRELDGGIDAARSRNRKKKYCLVALGEFWESFFSCLFPLFIISLSFNIKLTSFISYSRIVVLVLIIVAIVVILSQTIMKK